MPKKIDLPVVVETPGLKFDRCPCKGFVRRLRTGFELCDVCGHDALDHGGDGPCKVIIASRDEGPTWSDIERSTEPTFKAYITNITTPEGY